MRYVLAGLGMVFSKRRLWPYVWGPMVAGAAVWAGIVVLGWLFVVPALSRWIDSWGLGGIWGALLANAVYAASWVLLSGVVYLSLVGVLSSILWDRLSAEIERELGREAVAERLGCGAIAADAVYRALFSCAIAAACLIVGLCTLGLGSVVLAGWLGLYDYTAPSFLRRGATFPRQFSEAFECRGWAGFVLLSGLLTLLPLVNALMLPALVAGGTMLVVESEGALGGRERARIS
jgi:uncharacterized protein involved in cysteine biosynthesis